MFLRDGCWASSALSQQLFVSFTSQKVTLRRQMFSRNWFSAQYKHCCSIDIMDSLDGGLKTEPRGPTLRLAKECFTVSITAVLFLDVRCTWISSDVWRHRSRTVYAPGIDTSDLQSSRGGQAAECSGSRQLHPLWGQTNKWYIWRAYNKLLLLLVWQHSESQISLSLHFI